MSKNELVVGQPRLGWLFDNNEHTPDIAVMLMDTGDSIELTVPLRGGLAEDDPYSRWFMPEAEYGDDPDRSKYTYAPPRNIIFSDSYGVVVLVGCRAGRSLVKILGNLGGHGKITSNYAVLGGRSFNYDAIHGMRTEAPGITAWTRIGSVSLVQAQEGTGGTTVLEGVKLNVPKVVEVSNKMNLTLEPRLRHEKEGGSADERVTIYNSVALQTLIPDAVDWETHLKTHVAVLDLASIAAWHPFGFSLIQVHRADDPVRTLSGCSIEDRWADVKTHRLWSHKIWEKRPRFLFPYDEIEPNGINSWIALRNDYKEALDLFIDILRSDEPWSRTSIVQSGIMLETLGYLVDTKKFDKREQNKNKRERKRSQLSFNCTLQIILEDLNAKQFDLDHISEHLMPAERWIEETNRVYMGLKHYDRETPDSLDSLNSLKMNLQIMRCWVALQLGVRSETLVENLKLDPLSMKFR